MQMESRQVPQKSIQTFFSILKDYINQQEMDTFATPMTEELLDDLCYLGAIHSVAPVLYYMFRTREKELADLWPEQMNWLRQQYIFAVTRSINQEIGKKEIQEAFRSQGIPVIFFKGIQIRSFYPVPETRTMGDLDCLICEEDRGRAHELMTDLGYSCSADQGNVWVYQKGMVVIEMHSRIAGNNISNGVDYMQFFSDAVNQIAEEDEELCLKREYHFCFLIYHIAKHISSTGAGVRMFMDLVIFLKHYGMTFDKEKAERMLKEASLDKVAVTIENLCDRWFDFGWGEEEMPEEVLNELEEYVVAGGTFGFATHNIGDVYRRKSYEKPGTERDTEQKRTIKMFWHYLFPGKEYMSMFIPGVKKHTWLLPAAWVKRGWIGLFRRRQHTFSTIRSMTKNDGNRSYREYQMLKKIGL